MNLTIVGLGVVGCSMGLALKSVAADLPITGHDPDSERARRAKACGAVDETHWNLLSACEKADLIVLDLSLAELTATLPILGREAKEGAVLVDTCALKRPVLDLALTLPPRVSFVGGHILSPGLGAEATPSAEALRGATFYLAPAEGTTPQALDMVTNLAEAVGAQPHFGDALEHDGVVAAMAQAPLLCALSLLDILTTAPGARERRMARGPEFAALAEMIEQSPQTPEMLLANREALLPWLEAAETQLARWRQNLEHLGAVEERLTRARAIAAAWKAGAEQEERHSANEALSGWRQMFLGSLGRRRRS